MKTKIVTVIGARPQIIKSSAISRAIRNKYHDKLEEVIVHTGQHYDDNMSQVFFVELNIPSPKYNLKIGSASHAVQTAEMMKGLEEVFKKSNLKPLFYMAILILHYRSYCCQQDGYSSCTC